MHDRRASGADKFCSSFAFATAIGLMLLGAGCQTPSARDPRWKETVARVLPVLGHRNWIVIADSAYPAQSGQGIETIYTGTGQLEAVRWMLGALDQARHVKPAVYVDAELEHVPENLAPGIANYRRELNELLRERRVNSIPHEELIGKLDHAGKQFRILILKTGLRLPYTSVFLELDCGYWDAVSEGQMRQAISAQK